MTGQTKEEPAQPAAAPRVRLLAPLRSRDFRLLWTGMTLSLLGDGVLLVALAWQVAVGRTALRALLSELLSREERYSWVAGDVHEVASGDTLHLVAEAELTVHLPDGRAGWRPEERLPYRVSGVLQHEPDPGTWRWRLCLGSEPVVPGAV